MKCGQVRQHLSAYLDGVIAKSERRRVEEHLTGCAGCRALMEELGRNIEWCRGLPESVPPPDFRRKVERAVQEAAADPQRPAWQRLGRWRGDLRWKRAAMAIAGAVILVVVAGIALEDLAPWPTALKTALDLPRVTDDAVREGAGRPESGAAMVGTARDRKIIQNADIEVAVADFRQSFQEIVLLTETAGGFVESSSFWQGEGKSRGGSLRLRVPQENFTNLLARIGEQGQVLRKDIHGRDVTQTYVDLDARLRALRVQEERLLLILGRANTVGEVLQVEAQRAQVRAEIESLTAMLQQYDRMVSFSTIVVNLVPPREAPPPPPGDLGGRLREAFLRSLRWLAYLGEQVLIGLSTLAPIIVLGGAAYLGIRRYRSRQRV